MSICRNRHIGQVSKNACTGCTACASVCPVHAISMQPDAMGFAYPIVDLGLCSGCGVCEKICPVKRNGLFLNRTIMAYGARHKDLSEIMRSRSGAVFVALSDYVLGQGGIVYGAGYSDDFVIMHKRAVTRGERDEFRGSKYVQSNLDGIFSQVKQDLARGLTVLFSGTPCQTAGLLVAIPSRLRPRLLVVDIVCHGVCSPAIWQDYLSEICKHHKGKLVTVQFRDKQHFGWGAHRETYVFEDDCHKLETDSPKNIFYRDLYFRRSCAKCQYTTLKRPSDLTLGDFWGWNLVSPEFGVDDKGVSLVLVNSEVGRRFFNAVKDGLDCFPVKLEKVLQPNLCTPTLEHPLRRMFEDDYAKLGFESVNAKYSHVELTIWQNLVHRGRLFLKKLNRRIKGVIVKCGLVY